MNSISQPQYEVVVIASGISEVSTSTRCLHRPSFLAPPGHISPQLALHKAAEGPGLAHRLKAPLKVLVVVAVDNGVDAGVGESQPVGKREDVAGEKVQLLSVQTCIVCHHQEGPEWQPGQHEKQSH